MNNRVLGQEEEMKKIISSFFINKNFTQPFVQVVINFFAALVEAVITAGIEQQLARLTGAGEDVLGAGVGQHFIGGAMHQEQRLGAEAWRITSAGCLAAQGNHSSHGRRGCAGGNDHRTAKGMPNQDDLVALPAL